MGNIFEDAMEEGIQRGLKQGKLTTLYDLVHDGLLSIQVAAMRVGMTEKEFTSEMHKAGY